MTKTWHDDFEARVDYAARVISEGRDTSCNRKFDSTCENDDGDAVVAALVRRAENNPRLAANLYRYINRECAAEAAAKFAGKNLAEEARAMRERSAIAWQAQLAAWDARDKAAARQPAA